MTCGVRWKSEVLEKLPWCSDRWTSARIPYACCGNRSYYGRAISVIQNTETYFCFIDNIFRFCTGWFWVSALLDVANPQLDISLHCPQNGKLQERIASTKQVLLHLFRSCICPDGWPDRPGSGNNLCPSGCSNNIIQKNCWAGYLSGSGSSGILFRILEADVVGEEHYEVARRVQKFFRNIKNCRILLQFLVWKSCLMKTKIQYIVQKKDTEILSQPFHA